MQNLIVKMRFGSLYFVGAQEIFGYLKIDPNMTFGVMMEEHMEEAVRLLFDQEALEAAFNQTQAFTDESSVTAFKNRPEHIEMILTRIEEYEDAHEKVTVEMQGRDAVLRLDLGDGLLVEGTRLAIGCIKMDPKMTCEMFIKKKIDPFFRAVINIQALKELYHRYPAFSHRDCEREFEGQPKLLQAALQRLKKIQKREKAW